MTAQIFQGKGRKYIGPDRTKLQAKRSVFLKAGLLRGSALLSAPSVRGTAKRTATGN